MNVTLLSGIVATSAILFSLTAWSVDYRIGNFSRLSGIQAEAMDVNGGLDALELGPYDRLYVDLTGDEDPYAEIMSAFNGGATIILFSPDFVQAGPASIQTMERIQNKLIQLTGVAVSAPYVVLRSQNGQPEFRLASSSEALQALIVDMEPDLPRALAQARDYDIPFPMTSVRSVGNHVPYIPEKNFNLKLTRRNIRCNLHDSKDFNGTMDYCQGDASIDVNVNVSMIRSVVAPKPDHSGNTRNVKLVRFSVSDGNTGAGIHLRDRLLQENAWKQSNIHRHTRLGPFAHSYSMSVEPVSGVQPTIMSGLPGNENPEYNHQQVSTVSIGVNGKVGAELSAEGPKGSAEVGASFGLSMSRSLSWDTKEYRIRNSSSQNNFSVTWERSLDECQLLLRNELGCYFTAGIAWGGKMWDENKINPIAYSNFVPNMDVVYEVSPEQNGTTKFLVTAATNIKAQFGYVGWDFLFGWYQPAGASSLTQSTQAFVTVDWSHPIFEPEAHVKLRSLYADNLCLTNQNGRIIGKACVPNNRHQTWGLDAKERYKSRSGNNQCLGIDDNNGLYVDTCNENLSQKWYWEDEKLVSRKIDDHGHNLVLQWHGEESDQNEVISEPLSDGLNSSWRNELSVLM